MQFTQLREGLRRRLMEMVEGGMTGSELAGRIGVAQAHVSNILLGKRGFSFELADQLLAVAEIGAEDLIAPSLLEECSHFKATTSGIAVPIVEKSSALKPSVQRRHLIGQVHIDSALVRQVKAPRARGTWERLIAVKIADCEFVLIDRYDCAPAQGRTFVVTVDGNICVGKLEMVSGDVIFSSDKLDEPLVASPTVVGRLLQIQIAFR